MESIPKNGSQKVKGNLLEINSRTSHPHTKVSLCVVPVHPNSAKEERDVPDQRYSSLTVKIW